MQHLAETVVSRLTPTALLTNAPVQALQREAGSWVVSAGMQSDEFDSVIIALPAPAAAQVLRMVSPELSAELAAIQYSSSITVALGYDRDVRQSLPPGFGFLVPRSEGKRLLAATFVHNKFPHRAPEDRALLRCFFAGNNAEDVWPLTDDQIIGIVRNELQQILVQSACAPSRSSPASTNGSRPWRNTASDISTASTASNACASSCPASRSLATPTAASACPTASAPAATPQSNS